MTSPIRCLFVANRSEIVARIARTCRDLGVRVVGCFVDDDIAHVRHLDAARQIAGYLDVAALIDAARSLGADALHPGYGFLAEDAGFARAVVASGLTWVGPRPDAIAAMGSKAEARRRVAAAGVPVLPGYDGEAQDDASLVRAAEGLGYPLIVKASAGGGGKGMSVVTEPDGLLPALATARRLAASAFGDPRLILERFVRPARHVEVQIIGDSHGNTLHLFERECSLQRRHQKVVEEAPSPAFVGRDDQRAVLLSAAVEAARAVDYVGLGTVEFVVDAAGSCFFLEMNTRIQVEHPVTELVLGLDLVALQLGVAAGGVLPLRQADVQTRGWAVEARLYAEDPDDNYMPSSGPLLRWRPPTGAGVRVDTAFVEGDVVGSSYDPMLAKVIGWGDDRATAIARLDRALAGLHVAGVRTNRGWLRRVLAMPEMGTGALHTGLLADVAPPNSSPSIPLAAAALHWAAPSPIPGIRAGWSNGGWPAPPLQLSIDGDTHAFTHHTDDAGLVLGADPWGDAGPPPGVPRFQPSAAFPVAHRVRALGCDRLQVGALVCVVRVVGDGDGLWVSTSDADTHVRRVPLLPPPASVADTPGDCRAPMPGKVVQVNVMVGDLVAAGHILLVLEAMKMEHNICAPHAGTVTSLPVSAGAQVTTGQPLATVEDHS